MTRVPEYLWENIFSFLPDPAHLFEMSKVCATWWDVVLGENFDCWSNFHLIIRDQTHIARLFRHDAIRRRITSVEFSGGTKDWSKADLPITSKWPRDAFPRLRSLALVHPLRAPDFKFLAARAETLVSLRCKAMPNVDLSNDDNYAELSRPLGRLKRLAKLRILQLCVTQKKDVRAIADACPDLTELRLRAAWGSTTEEIDGYLLPRCARLQKFKLHTNELALPNLRLLSDLRTLSIHSYWAQHIPNFFKIVAELKSLRTLELDTEICDTGLASAPPSLDDFRSATFPSGLESVVLSGGHGMEEGAWASAALLAALVRDCPNLNCLFLIYEDDWVTDADVAALSSICVARKLADVSLQSKFASPEAISDIVRLWPRLEHLYADDDSIWRHIESWEALSGAVNLSRISIATYSKFDPPSFPPVDIFADYMRTRRPPKLEIITLPNTNHLGRHLRPYRAIAEANGVRLEINDEED